jgi:hypothetical protein
MLIFHVVWLRVVCAQLLVGQHFLRMPLSKKLFIEAHVSVLRYHRTLKEFPMRAVPAGQPAGLGTDELALPMITLVANTSLVGLTERGQNRASVTCKIEQLPLRPANAVTTFACIGSEFNRYVILETNVAQFYTQISRGKFGLENVSIAAALRKGFCASPRDGVAEEMENLKVRHDKTLLLFS